MVITTVAQTSEVRQVGSFRGVKAGEAINVTLKKGDKESVKVDVDGVSLNAVITEVSGNYLRIHMREGSYRNRKVDVAVTYVTLERISASSACSVNSEGVIKSTSLDINAASAATVELEVDTETLTLDVASAGDVRLEGKAKRMTIEASSAGVADTYGLACDIVSVTASSAGTAKVSVSKELEAEASSGGSIRYRGSPSKANTGSSSGGSVKKSN